MTDLITQDNKPANLPQLELEIKFYLGQTAQNIIEVGKRLIQAKSLVNHGHWQAWLEQNFQLSQMTANNFMRAAERFGKIKIDFNFKPTQLITLLALPSAEETEKFIAEKAAEGKKVAEMTIKELREEIADYKKAMKMAVVEHQQSLFDFDNQKAQATTAHQKELDDLNNAHRDELDDRDEQIAELEKELKDRPTVEPSDYQQTKKDLTAAQVELGKTQAELKHQADNFKKQTEELKNNFSETQKQLQETIDKQGKEIKKKDKKIEHLEKKSYAPPTELQDDSLKLFCADIRSGLLDIADNSVDFIITDPPYPKEYLPLYEDLSKLAARVLKDGGSLICMTGQSYLPEVIQLLATSMNYHWCLCYSMPGQKTQLWQRHLHTSWKPLLWFVKGNYKGDWLGTDVMTSPGRDKAHHEWGQSNGGMKDIIEHMTNPNDVILDPFLGGGTTGVAALTCKRKFIGVDIEQKNIDVTKSRIAEEFNNADRDT